MLNVSETGDKYYVLGIKGDQRQINTPQALRERFDEGIRHILSRCYAL